MSENTLRYIRYEVVVNGLSAVAAGVGSNCGRGRAARNGVFRARQKTHGIIRVVVVGMESPSQLLGGRTFCYHVDFLTLASLYMQLTKWYQQKPIQHAGEQQQHAGETGMCNMTAVPACVVPYCDIV